MTFHRQANRQKQKQERLLLYLLHPAKLTTVAGMVASGVTAKGLNGIEAEANKLAKPKLRSEEHTSELQSLAYLVCRLLLEKRSKFIFGNIDRLDQFLPRKIRLKIELTANDLMFQLVDRKSTRLNSSH